MKENSKKQAQTPLQFMMQKTASSCLDPSHVKKLGLKAYDVEAVKKELPDLVPCWHGFKIPYFTLDGKLRSDDFFRYRIQTDRLPDKGWKSVASPDKPQKYAQLKGSGCAVYFPPLLDWRAVAEDPDVPLVITEGELKAASVCSFGIPCFGLGGVWNWRTAGLDRDRMLPELEALVWDKRKIIILFDSDIESNPHVRAAAGLFCSVLVMRNATVHLTHPPSTKQKGIDDWLFSLKPAKREESLGKLLVEAPEMEGSSALHRLNMEVARVTPNKEYVDLTSGRRMGKRELSEETEYGARTYAVETAEGNTKQVPVVKAWLTWKYCRELAGYTYAPGQSQITVDNKFNLWRGWGCAPREGDVTPFLDLFNMLMHNANDTDKQWLLSWLAVPLQQPGLKLRNGVVLWGGQTGTGKTLLAQTMRRIYGPNFGEIESKHFHSSFNSYLVGKQFILGDEISVQEKRSVSERLKVMLTREMVQVEEKYQVPYMIEDRANYYFTSNYPDAFYVEEHDRRFFVHEVTSQPLTTKFTDRYFKWLEGGGASSLFQYFLDLDCKSFQPFERPPMTEAKTEMIDVGRSDVRRWIEDVKRDPVGMTGRNGYLYTVRQLIAAYSKENETAAAKMDTSWMGKELAKAGVRKAAGGSNMIKVDGKMSRVHIVGAPPNIEAQYMKLRPIEVQALMDKMAEDSPRKKFEAQMEKARVQ